MGTRVSALLAGTALATGLLTGCGGDKVSDVASAEAQQCKADIKKLFDGAGSSGGFSEDDKPESCANIEDEVGGQILTQINDEARAKVREQLGRADAGGAGSAGASGSAAGGTSGSAGTGSANAALTAAGSAGSMGVSTESAAGSASGSGALTAGPAKLPVGNAEWELAAVKLQPSGLDLFGGTYTLRYLGTGDNSLPSDTLPSGIGVFVKGEEIASLIVSAGVFEPGQSKTQTIVSDKAFAKGPYTFELRFE